MTNLGLPDVRHVAFAGDWHGQAQYARRAINHLTLGDGPHVDAVLHLGDFGYKFTADYLNQIQAAARRADLIVAFVDGNHEDFDWLLAQPVDNDGVRRLRDRVWHLPRGLRWEWSGKQFLALGGAVSVDKYGRTPGASWWPQETITDAQAWAAIADGPADIMVCHDTPAGYEIPRLGDPNMWAEGLIRASNQHRELLAEVVNLVRPRYLWHGHYHVPRYALQFGDCRIAGLDCDGNPFHENLEVIDLLNLPAHGGSFARARP